MSVVETISGLLVEQFHKNATPDTGKRAKAPRPSYSLRVLFMRLESTAAVIGLGRITNGGTI